MNAPDNRASHTVTLPAALDREVASDLQQSLLRVLEVEGAVVLDASSVETVDTVALQVVTAFVHECVTAGREVRWQGATPPLLQMTARLGLHGPLGLAP